MIKNLNFRSPVSPVFHPILFLCSTFEELKRWVACHILVFGKMPCSAAFGWITFQQCFSLGYR